MSWKNWKPCEFKEDAGTCIEPVSGLAKHREWRGFWDTAYDFVYWLDTVAAMGKFIMFSPVRVIKGMLRYRWMGSCLGTFNMIDKTLAGLQGPALHTGHIYMKAVVQTAINSLETMLKADKRFGDNDSAEKIVLLEQTMPPEAVGGFPNLQPVSFEMFQNLIACTMDQNLCPHYLDRMEALGLPSDSCRLSASACGVAINDDYPQIGKCIIINNMPCDSSAMNSQLISRYLNLPSLPGCMPMRWDEPGTEEFATEQIREIIHFVEKQTGESFDWESMKKELIEHNEEEQRDQQRSEFMATPYAALGGEAITFFHLMFFTLSSKGLDYYKKADKKALRIMEDCYKNKVNCFPKARHRVLAWGAPACYYITMSAWMYNCWGVLQIHDMNDFIGGGEISTANQEEAFLGVAKLYERSLMRRHLTGGYQHLLEFIEQAKRFDCDMVIVHADMTCKGGLGLTGIIGEEAQKNGLNLVWLEHDIFDHRTVTRSMMRKQFSDFMFNIMKESPIDASLLEFDDS